MKKTLSLLALSFTAALSAQNFSFEYSNSVTENVDGDEAMTVLVQNYVVNETNATIDNLNWTLEEVTLPEGWSLYTFCDNNLCYYLNEDNIDSFFNDEVSFQPIDRNQKSDFKIEVTIPANSPAGYGIVKANVIHYTDANETTVSEEQMATFIVNKGNVGVEVIDIKDERVALYPNPGNEQLFVYTDKSLSATNYQVFDLMGRKVMTGAIQGETTTINASALQTGHYLVKLIDNDNNSITTRKWIKK